MTILLHRAFKNAGDWLIFERTRQLVSAVLPEEEIVVGHAAIPLGEQVASEVLRRAKAIVVC